MNIGKVVDSQTLSLFRTITRAPLRFSLIGYSLGGLRALTEFLRDRYEARAEDREPLFSSCVAINSGGALSDLRHPHWVDKDRWKQMMQDLLQQRLVEGTETRFKRLPEAERMEAERHFAFLEDVFLGKAVSINTLEGIDSNASQRLFFILGGGDDLVPLQSLERFAPSGGLNLLQIAGMGHLYAYDSAWGQWKRVVFDLIAQFVQQTASRSAELPSVDRTLEYLALFDHATECLPFDSNLEDQVVFDAARKRLEAHQKNLCRAMLGQPRTTKLRESARTTLAELDEKVKVCGVTLLDKVQAEIKRRRLHPGAYKNARRELLIGSKLMGQGNKKIIDSLGNLKGANGTKLGDVLVSLGLVDNTTLNHCLSEQDEQLEKIRERFSRSLRDCL